MQHGDDHLPQAVLHQVPDVHDGDEPRVPDVRVHGEVLSVPDVQECVAKSEVRCSLPWSQQNLRSCRAVVKPLLSPAVSCHCCSACSPERSRASKGSRTGASLNLFSFLIPLSLFQDVEIQVLHRAMPSALNSSVSDECISSPMLREADAQLIPTGAQEDLDLQLVRPWRMITCILMLPSEVHSYPHPIPLFLQLLLLSTTIGDTS